MPDLGERGNVMGPQPIAAVSSRRPRCSRRRSDLLNSLMRGRSRDGRGDDAGDVRDEMMRDRERGSSEQV